MWKAESPERKRRRKDPQGTSSRCPVCLENRPVVVLMPCGHVVCQQCQASHRFRQCPMCRVDFTGATKGLFLWTGVFASSIAWGWSMSVSVCPVIARLWWDDDRSIWYLYIFDLIIFVYDPGLARQLRRQKQPVTSGMPRYWVWSRRVWHWCCSESRAAAWSWLLTWLAQPTWSCRKRGLATQTSDDPASIQRSIFNDLMIPQHFIFVDEFLRDCIPEWGVLVWRVWGQLYIVSRAIEDWGWPRGWRPRFVKKG